MSLVKTDKGKQALQARDPGLSPRERQILVLCNGQRSPALIVGLMGAMVEQDLRRLVADAYVTDSATAPKSAAVPIPVEQLPVRDVRPTEMPRVTLPPAVQPAPPPQQQPLSRRSLAATKMYVIDMLQLMRDMDTSAMAVNVHTSVDEAAFMVNVLEAARLIAVKSGASYGVRVISKLREIAPEHFLPHLEDLVREFDLVSV